MMKKVIVTGATGFTGAEVVRQCIKHPEIGSIVALVRRPLDEELSQNKKVQVVINKDFEQYSSEILDQLKGADGCIWTLGGKAEDFPNVDTARKVQRDYCLAAAKAFQQTIAPETESGKMFQFSFCSGQGAEWSPSASLWMFKHTRLIKGETEKGLFELAEQHPDSFQVTVIRPGGILSQNSIITKLMKSYTIDVSVLASAFVESIVNSPKERITENADIAALVWKSDA